MKNLSHLVAQSRSRQESNKTTVTVSLSCYWQNNLKKNQMFKRMISTFMIKLLLFMAEKREPHKQLNGQVFSLCKLYSIILFLNYTRPDSVQHSTCAPLLSEALAWFLKTRGLRRSFWRAFKKPAVTFQECFFFPNKGVKVQFSKHVLQREQKREILQILT